jgi:hypothetical protein
MCIEPYVNLSNLTLLKWNTKKLLTKDTIEKKTAFFDFRFPTLTHDLCSFSFLWSSIGAARPSPPKQATIFSLLPFGANQEIKKNFYFIGSPFELFNFL